MNFLLKIVEGPNKGAEIALVEGLCVSIGKADSCDIILADPTLPDVPFQIEAAADSVSIEMPGEGRRHLDPYHVETVGSTSFAVGGADAAWPALVWPTKEEPKKEEESPSEESPAAKEEVPAKKEEPKEDEKKKRGVWLIAAIAAVLVLLILCALGWIFRDRISAMLTHGGEDQAIAGEEKKSPIDELVERYSLDKKEDDGRIVLVGNFDSRSERLAATAQAYAAQPGVELDFVDEESLKAAVEETLALVGENELTVASVKNRVATLAGKAANLRMTLEAISADVPKLANVDCSAVAVGVLPPTPEAKQEQVRRQAAKKAKTVDFPVCGIVTDPYPCLVMRNGMRIMEGAAIGENVIVKIEADKITITNSAGRVIWKP